MNQIEIAGSHIVEQNLTAFHAFIKNVKNPVHVDDHEVLISANVIYYQYKQMHQLTACVIFSCFGPDEGTIQIVQQDIEAGDMNVTVNIDKGHYSLGRSATVLTIGNIPGKTTRIDLEENAHLMKSVN